MGHELSRGSPTLLAWSSGKDSAHALHVLRQLPGYEVVALVTTVDADSGATAMHAISAELLGLQVSAVGLPLWTVPVPWPCANDDYEAAMRGVNRRASAEGIRHIAYGDLFLQDIRSYREEMLRGSGITPVFPIWRRDTDVLAREMIDSGLRATIACVDPARVPAGMAGREFDSDLVRDLPRGCDPCGENGEFHTFAWDGPVFSHPVPITTAGIVDRDGFVFAELKPAQEGVTRIAAPGSPGVG
ncbi:MAG: Dph6-related ATP pyrophosphatase [Candidatus Dormibacteria bacterium]